MQFQAETTIDAPAQRIFAEYEQVTAWHLWDNDIAYATLDGAFAAGSQGILKPVNGPKNVFVLLEVIENSAFTTQSKLPFCYITFEHQLTSTATMTKVVHSVRFEGMLSFFFGHVIGSSIKKGLPTTLQSLKQRCEDK